MATVRQITVILSRHLGVDVTPYAARLVRERMLPRRGEPIDERETATLLLAVFSASDPDRAIEALNSLADATVHQVEHAIPGTAPDVHGWRRVAKEGFSRAAESALDVVAEALQGGVNIKWLSIDDGGDAAMFEIAVPGEPPFVYRLAYMNPATQKQAGIMRLAQVEGTVISALVGILCDDERRPAAAPASLELH